jgi:hypothetical protein
VPMEYTYLRHKPEPFAACPRCGAAPFRSFMPRGSVQRRKKKYFLWGRWPYCSITCDSCREIVGHEDPHSSRVEVAPLPFFRRLRLVWKGQVHGRP